MEARRLSRIAPASVVPRPHGDPDGWEREGESRELFGRFSQTKSYPFGVNLVLYALSH